MKKSSEIILFWSNSYPNPNGNSGTMYLGSWIPNFFQYLLPSNVWFPDSWNPSVTAKPGSTKKTPSHADLSGSSSCALQKSRIAPTSATSSWEQAIFYCKKDQVQCHVWHRKKNFEGSFSLTLHVHKYRSQVTIQKVYCPYPSNCFQAKFTDWPLQQALKQSM